MLKKVADNIYRFNSGTKIISVEELDDGVIEVYEDADPYRTGFIFENLGQFVSTINNLSDVVEILLTEKEDEDK